MPTIQRLRDGVLLFATLTLCSCGGGSGSGSGGGDDDMQSPPPMLTQQTLALDYVDAAGDTRAINIEIRPPAGATTPVPVVLWSHGGAGGESDPTSVGEGWTAPFVNAGYCMVAIAHAGRPCASQERLRVAVGYSAVIACNTWKYLSWDRPHDVRRVLDYLEAETAPGGTLAGLLDMNRVAYAGHSAGAGAVLVTAGARREIAGLERDISDPRPKAFISCSPQGVGFDDFTDSSYRDRVTRPHLTLSGKGDTTNGVPDPITRLDAFMIMAPGDKYVGWNTETEAAHNLFNGKTSTCVSRGATLTQCEEFLEWNQTAAIAFLDAHVKGDAAALALVQSDELKDRTGAIFTWVRR